MMPKLKICGMKDPQNIQEVLDIKPDFLGFIFYAPSPRYIGNLSPGWLKQLKAVQKVGVFVNEELWIIRQQVEAYGLDFVQLHGDESPDFAHELKQMGIPLIKAFGIDTSFDWKQVEDFDQSADYFLFDTKSNAYGGTGRSFDWQLLSYYQLDKPYFLSGGITKADIPAIEQLNDQRLFAVDVNSKFEVAPGLKDKSLLQAAFGHKLPIK